MSEEMSGQPEILRIRPHHGLCTAFFRGEGYSGDFVKNMAEVIRLLEKGDPKVIISEGADDICKRCPNLIGGICSGEKSDRYDRAVLEICGLSYGREMNGKDLSRLVREKIISAGRLSEVCGDCQWFFICISVES